VTPSAKAGKLRKRLAPTTPARLTSLLIEFLLDCDFISISTFLCGKSLKLFHYLVKSKVNLKFITFIAHLPEDPSGVN
jgi:hypothetical protein